MANKKTIPQSACRLTGSIETANDDNGQLKLEILARKNEMIEHHIFKWLLHEFSSMHRRPVICADFEHGPEIIGYIDDHRFNDNGDLIVIATLTGSTAFSKDIIQMIKDGIPLQASIDFDRPFNVLQVPAGNTITVNGKEFIAPAPYLCVIKDWELCAVAICKVGYDPHTQVNKLSGEERQISYTTIGESTMANPNSNAPAANTQQSAATAAESEENEVEETVEGEETPGEETPAEETPAADKPAVDPAPAAASTQTDEQLKLTRFNAVFGAENAMSYLSSGLSFEAALEKNHAQLKNKISELETTNADLENRLSTINSGTPPTGFVPNDKSADAQLSAEEKKVAELVRKGMSEGEAQLAVGMKVRS